MAFTTGATHVRETPKGKQSLGGNVPVNKTWRSMSSAPRDGEKFFIAVHGGTEDDYVHGVFLASYFVGVLFTDADDLIHNEEEIVGWLPLPDLPPFP